MRDAQKLTVQEFFVWQAQVDGRYELVDGFIIPHPDYLGPQGLAVPDTEHARICANLIMLIGPSLKAPSRLYVGAVTVVEHMNANVPDLALSCVESDASAPALRLPKFVFEVSSPKTARVDTGRKVSDYLGIASLEVYCFVDRAHRCITLYRRDAGPQTYSTGAAPLANDLHLSIDAVFA